MTTGPGDLPPVPLARLFAMAGRYLVERLHQRLADRGWPDIPPATGYVLLAARTGPTTGGEIAQLMRTSKQAASKLLESMERRGFVERGAAGADARTKAVVLTDQGRALLAAVEDIYVELESDWAGLMGHDTLELIRTSLTRALIDAYGGTLPAIGPS
ncbi:MarR family winged helix-turn-helix transcriptional regulator [Dactylosporangium cerinum]|uniref:MarR family winged helix-turn-helix transcriptional regulator n=1 Tax=Dactylosporangium cerinum TaxID=1434730 RepID=A0ABV9VQB1_9ACTN